MTGKNIDQGWKTTTTKLSRPIGAGEDQISEITLYEPDMGVLDQINKVGLTDDENDPEAVSKTIEMISILSRQDPEIVAKLHPVDFAEVAKSMAPLLADGQKAMMDLDEGGLPDTPPS